jgi:hypothetical protein
MELTRNCEFVLSILTLVKPKPFDMHQEHSRITRSRKEDRELIRAIIFFTIIAVFVGLLLIKGAL